MEAFTLKARCSEGLVDTAKGKAVAGRTRRLEELVLSRNTGLVEACAAGVEYGEGFRAAGLGDGGHLAGGESQDC